MTPAPREQLGGIVARPAIEAPEAAPVEVRVLCWQGFLLAVGSLVLIFAVGIGVTVAGGTIIQHFDPTRQINNFAAFHNAWIVSVLLGITVLWLLPPYPWAKRAIASDSREQQPASTAGGTEDGDAGPVTARLEVAGPGAVPRPVGNRGAGTSLLGDA